MGATAFDLIAKLTLDSAEYDKGLDDAESKANGIGGKLGSALGGAAKVGAAAIGAATTAVGAFAKKSLDAGMSFDASMSNVSAISGAVGSDFDALRDKAQEMGASTKFTATEAADAMSYMAMAGWKTGDMLDGISGIMNLAAASGEDLALTSDIVTDALTGFGLKASDSSHFADILAAASSNANTNVALMGETFKYVAPVAGSMGISAEDAAESIGLIANAGIKGSQAGTSLRSIITRLATDAGASSKSLGALGVLTEELGVQFYDTEGNVRDFSDILDEARVKWQELSDEDASTFAKKIAGQEGISAWLALMNSAPEDVDKLRSAIDTCSDSADGFNGTAERMAGVMQDNLQGSITIFQSALEGVQIAFSDMATPALKEFVDIGTEGLSGVANALREGDFSGAMEALGDALSKGIEKLISVIPEMIDAGIQLLSALGQGLLQNMPVILDAAVQIVSSLSNFIVSAMPELMTAALEIIMALVGYIVSDLPKLMDAAIEIIFALADGIIDAIPDLIPALVEIILTIVEKLTEPSTIMEMIDVAFKLLGAIGDGLLQAIPTLVEKVPTIIMNLIEAILRFLPQMIASGMELIAKLAIGILQAGVDAVHAIIKVVGSIKDGFMERVNDAKEWGKDLIQNFIDGVLSKWNDLKESVSNVAQTVKNFLGFSEPKEGPLSNFHTYAPDMMELFAQGVKDNERVITDQIAKSFDFGDSMINPVINSGSMVGGGTNITMNVYGAQGQDMREFANYVISILDQRVNRRQRVWA